MIKRGDCSSTHREHASVKARQGRETGMHISIRDPAIGIIHVQRWIIARVRGVAIIHLLCAVISSLGSSQSTVVGLGHALHTSPKSLVWRAKLMLFWQETVIGARGRQGRASSYHIRTGSTRATPG